MSHENIYLVVLSIVLCALNVFLDPLSLRVATLFGKRSMETEQEGEVDKADSTETPMVSGPAGAHTRIAR